MNINEIIARAVHEKLSAEECAALAEHCSRAESAAGELAALRRRGRLEKIAVSRGFADSDYLDFLAVRDGVEIDDPEAVEKFMDGLAAAAPGFFTVAVAPGAGGGADNPPGAAARETGPGEPSDILDLLASAPEI